MINIRDFKTKEEGEHRVCKLKTALKKSNEDLFYVRYLVGNAGREDYLDVVTSSPAVYCEVWKRQYRHVSILEAEEDLKCIEKRLKQMEVDKATLNISEEDEESLRISLEQSKAGLVEPFDLDAYLIPERNELPTLEEQLGESFEELIERQHYQSGKPF